MRVEANLKLRRDPTSQTGICQVWAQRLEFVGLPGNAAKLQREIPSVVQKAITESDGLVGCLALFSEEEGRLVTVITLWKDAVRLTQDSEVMNRLKRLLEPYVDQWLRSRNFVTFVCT